MSVLCHSQLYLSDMKIRKFKRTIQKYSFHVSFSVTAVKHIKKNREGKVSGGSRDLPYLLLNSRKGLNQKLHFGWACMIVYIKLNMAFIKSTKQAQTHLKPNVINYS